MADGRRTGRNGTSEVPEMPEELKEQLREVMGPAFEGEMSAIAKAAIAESQRPRTQSERRTEAIMAALEELGGHNVGDETIVWAPGGQFILPADMKDNIEGEGGVIEFLQKHHRQQNKIVAFSQMFNYRPYDGAAAFQRAMLKVFGTTGIGKDTVTPFGVKSPEMITIPSGPRGERTQVPWGKIELPILHAVFELGMDVAPEYGVVFSISVKCPFKNKKKIGGFFKEVERELRDHSIYRGHAITANVQQPDFIDTSVFDLSKIIYRKDVFDQLNANLWSPIKHKEVLEQVGVPMKRAVLLEGPNGTGKTLAGNWTAKLCEEHGWTFILVRAGDDPFQAMLTAKIYAPCVILVEDLERLGSASEDNTQITKLLDALDNVQSKNTDVMALFTSNFADKLVRDVVRPGRLDAVIPVGELDADGYARLIKSLVKPELLASDIDYGEVVKSYQYTALDLDGKEFTKWFLPAFAVEAIIRAIRYAVVRMDGHPDTITASDLATAAAGMGAHLEMMDNAMTRGQERPVLDAIMSQMITAASRNTLQGMLEASEIRGVDNYGDTAFVLREN